MFGINRGIMIHKNRITNPDLFQFPLLSSDLFYSKESIKLFQIRNKYFISMINTIFNSTIKHKQRQHFAFDKELSFNQLYYLPNQRQRYNLIHRDIIFNKKIVIIIKLQKALRLYLKQKSIKIQWSLTIIQSNIRRYLTIKNIKHSCFLNTISLIRKNSFEKILNKMLQYHNIVKFKESVISIMIYSFRNNNIVRIQNKYRTHYLSKLVHEIIEYEKTQYTLLYPFKAKEVYFKLYLNSTIDNDKYYFFNVKNKTRQFPFCYCTLRKMFVLYINKYEILQGKYKCQFIVDGYVTCDGRYSYIEHTDGNYYNILEFKNDSQEMEQEQEENSRNTMTDIGSEDICDL